MSKKCVTCGKSIRKGKNKTSLNHCTQHQPASTQHSTKNALKESLTTKPKPQTVLEQMEVSDEYEAEWKLKEILMEQISDDIPYNHRRHALDKAANEAKETRMGGWFQSCGDKGEIPAVWRNGGKDFSEWTQKVLSENGMPRTSSLAGGEVRGITTSYGSTGFSIRSEDETTADVHVVISGKTAGIRYIETENEYGDFEEQKPNPQDCTRTAEKIKELFKSKGLEVEEVSCTGYQMQWDDDIDFNIKVKKW